MRTLAAASARPTAGLAWFTVFLLFLVQVTNFADKTVVSLAAVYIMEEFNLSNEQYGIIGGAFYSLYAVSGILVAVFVAPRFRPRAIMAVLLIIWSLVQLPIVFAASFQVILVCRILLGMGEGAATPTALNAVHEWFPNESRNMPSALVMFGTTIGSMIAAPVLITVMEAFGWRAAFMSCGLFGAIVFLLWLVFSRDGPYSAATANKAQPSLLPPTVKTRRLWLEPSLWGTTIAGAAAYWLVGWQVSWLAPYLMVVGQDPALTGWLLSMIFACQAVCTLSCSFVSQILMKRGVSSRAARACMMGACIMVSGGGFIAIGVTDSLPVQIALLAIATTPLGAVFPLAAAIISEVTPIEQRNGVMTFIMSIITVVAVPSSIVTGMVVGATNENWIIALSLNGAIGLIGGFFCFLLINPERTIARFSNNQISNKVSLAAEP